MRHTREGKPIYDLDFTTHVQTPHIAWANPLVGGPLKVFAVPSIHWGREFSELSQRFSLDLHTVTIDRNWDVNKWGFGDFYHLRASQHDFRLLYSYLVDALTADTNFDVIVLPGTNGWSEFPLAAREAIIRRVQQGSGLVLLHPYCDLSTKAELEGISPLVGWEHEPLDTNSGYPKTRKEAIHSGRWSVQQPHYVTNLLPWEAFPYDELGHYGYQLHPAGQVLVASEQDDPIIAVREVGKGRVVGLAYFHRDLTPQHRGVLHGSGGALAGLYDTWGGAFSTATWPWWEGFYALIARALVWAARKEPAASLNSAAVAPDTAQLTVTVSGVAEGMQLEQVVRNDFNQVLGSSIISVPTHSESIVLPLAQRPAGGRAFVDLWLRSGEQVFSWGTCTFTQPQTTKIVSVDFGERFHQTGDLIEFTVQHHGIWEQMVLELVDEYDRVTYSVAQPYSDTPITVSVPTRAALTLTARMRATILDNAHNQLDCKYSTRFVLAPKKRDVDDFEVMLVQQNRGRGDLIEVARNQMVKTGVTGGFVGDRKLLAPSGARGLGIYWYHRAPYVERKEQFARTGEKLHLVRVPCLNDPEFITNMTQTVRHTVERYQRYASISYYAQDEGSLTCYSDAQDLCFCPHCLGAFRTWLQKVYHNLDTLNAEWGTTFTAWDAVVPYTAQEARTTGKYAAWADHRTFMEDTYAGVYAQVRDSICAIDPVGRVRMSGCQESVAHNGCDYSKLHQAIQYFEAYQVGDQYEFHRSFAQPGTVVGGWFGYGVSGDQARHSAWYGVLHGLTLMSIFWEYAWLNPDFTPSKSARDFGATFAEIKRSGIGKLLLHTSKRNHCGIAVHYSYPSIHATWIDGRAEQYKANRHGWIRLLENLGLQFNFVAQQQIEAGTLLQEGYKLLILPLSMAISAKEAAAIREFVAAGGTVIADYRTGVMNEHCTWQQEGCLDNLFGIERLETRWDGIYPSHGDPTGKLPDLQVSSAPLEETEIRAKEAVALLADDFSGHRQGILVNSTSGGKTVYLNFGMEKYSSGKEGQRMRWTIANMLSYLEISAPAAVVRSGTGEYADIEVFHYINDCQRYTAVLHSVAGDEVETSADGVVLAKEATDTGKARQPFTVQFPAPAHLYDTRRGVYLGYAASTTISMGSADIELIARLPYQVTGIDVETQLIDRQVHYTAQVQVNNGASPGKHVLHVELLNPAGDVVWYYAENVVANDGRVKGCFHLACNDTAGQWTLRVRDAATGVTACVPVTVAPFEQSVMGHSGVA